MNVEKMLENFTTVEEIKIYCASQAKQIQQLSKENKELKEKVANASKEVKEVIKRENSSTALVGLKILDDAKTISQVQLNLLKDLAFDRELTTDEAKRVEIYNKILSTETEKKEKPLKADVEVLSGPDLLKLVENV